MLKDPFYKSLAHGIKYKVRDGVWFKNDSIFLNPASPLIPTLIDECHSSPTGDILHISKHFHACAKLSIGLTCIN